MDVLWQATEALDTQDCCKIERIQRASIGQVCANPPLQLEEQGGGVGAAELSQEPTGAEGRSRRGACLGTHPPRPLSSQ